MRCSSCSRAPFELPFCVFPTQSGTRAFRSSAAPGLAAKAPLANPADLSPLKQFFYGRLDGPALFPFPSALSADEREAATALAEPVGKFFADKVNSAQIDWDHKIPEEVMQGLRDLGLFGLQIEERHGGLGLSNTEYARIVEELVTDPSIAVTLMAHQSIGLKGILMFGTEEQKAKYLPKLASGEHMASFCLTEPGAGSDAAGITTRAVPADDGSGDWLLSGGKSESRVCRSRGRPRGAPALLPAGRCGAGPGLLHAESPKPVLFTLKT